MSRFFKSGPDGSATGASSPELDSEKKNIDSEGSVEERESECESAARPCPRTCIACRADDSHLVVRPFALRLQTQSSVELERPSGRLGSSLPSFWSSIVSLELASLRTLRMGQRFATKMANVPTLQSLISTPGTIFRLSGSVGLALFVWVIGLLIALAGTLVYMEFGTGIPRNGGEKVDNSLAASLANVISLTVPRRTTSNSFTSGRSSQRRGYMQVMLCSWVSNITSAQCRAFSRLAGQGRLVRATS